MQGLKTALHRLITGLLALLLLFEEWGWEPLARAMAWLGRLPGLAALERRIASLGKWPALCVFGVPMLALLPIKLLALSLFGMGRPVLALSLLIAAKLAGTAVVARLFQLTQPALMQFGWFAHWYPRWSAWKEALLGRIRASWAWRQGRHLKQAAARALRRLWLR